MTRLVSMLVGIATAMGASALAAAPAQADRPIDSCPVVREVSAGPDGYVLEITEELGDFSTLILLPSGRIVYTINALVTGSEPLYVASLQPELADWPRDQQWVFTLSVAGTTVRPTFGWDCG